MEPAGYREWRQHVCAGARNRRCGQRQRDDQPQPGGGFDAAAGHVQRSRGHNHRFITRNGRCK